jgi:hypothetical protein
MGMHIKSVDFKVKPVKRKSLYQTQDSFAKESVEAKGYSTLIQKRNDRVAKDKRDKGVCSLNLVLNILAGEEVKCGFTPAAKAFCQPVS